jgi:hypothetical protein
MPATEPSTDTTLSLLDNHACRRSITLSPRSIPGSQTGKVHPSYLLNNHRIDVFSCALNVSDAPRIHARGWYPLFPTLTGNALLTPDLKDAGLYRRYR